MDNDALYHRLINDLRHLEQITEQKIQAVTARQSETLVALLQEQIDPMYRVNAHTLEMAGMTEPQRAELKSHITRWATREQYLGDLLEEHLGHVAYLRHLLGISSQERLGLDIGL